MAFIKRLLVFWVQNIKRDNISKGINCELKRSAESLSFNHIQFRLILGQMPKTTMKINARVLRSATEKPLQNLCYSKMVSCMLKQYLPLVSIDFELQNKQKYLHTYKKYIYEINKTFCRN